ncbi:unnamed protein product [Angiostrongylus costaricensis]|uniref:PAP-associated domain-containing protein n=1 Tax=Angiostrongylus costaricensis TaxID=334426 RepID=A0A0R3PA29_ANGCS|nr:unnamed protein product [Angiostrongylus costaricensis]
MIYGSTLNGFGTRTCDVDMSLSFPLGPPKGKVIVAKALVDYPNARDEQYICAKVPIVRFRGKDGGIKADISYRNDLALHNTKLLHQYCKWDRDRLPTLGIWVKTWAKRCGVGDASKGSLSSYAWILMLIHYLQRTEPIRMLPFLQLVNTEKRLIVILSGFQVLHSQCIAVSTFELFVGFLDYFSTYFQYERHVCYRPRNCRWPRCPMVISDPFELDHNLAQSVNEDMFQYICLCMEHSHAVFMDQNLRAEFLVSKGCPRGTADKVHMNDDLLREYGVSPFADVLATYAYEYVLITSLSQIRCRCNA